MPVHKCSNGKWRIGEGDCVYDTKEDAEKAYKAYLAEKHSNEEDILLKIKLDEMKTIIEDIKDD